MAKTILISDRVNSFFTNNKIKAGTEIPTSGSYIKGDIIVNVGSNCADEPMWICTEDGNPGTWGLVGIGGGGGSSSLVSINESVTINTATSEVSLGSLAGLVSSKDKLIVHYNSAHLMEGVDFTFNSDYTKIVKVEGVWNSNNDVDSLFTFELLKNVESIEGSTIKIDSKLSSFVNNVNISSAVTEVGIGIDGYNHESDMLMVFKNSTFIVEGVDYTVNGNKIVSMNGTWNSENSSNYSFAFVVFKEVAIINPDAVVNTENLVNGSVTMDKLADDVKQAIENASNIDLTGYQEKVDNGLVTVDTTIVGAINELFQSANNGKELIATAIGEPLNSSDTFSAMSTNINGLLSTFKTNMMNNGISVAGSDKFKQLIDKIATLADSEGKGIKYASGNSSITVPGENKYTGNLNFKPNILLLYTNSGFIIYNEFNSADSYKTVFYSGYVYNWTFANTGDYVNESGFSFGRLNEDAEYTWYAIGVGEEDTTLRDSLASILQEEGVNVTPEDDMANLITKTDEEFDRKNNQIASKNNEINNNKQALVDALVAKGIDATINNTWEELFEFISLFKDYLNLNKIADNILCGSQHTFILKNDGTLWGTGDNSSGQLGLSATVYPNVNSFNKVNVDNVKKVICGDNFSYIIKNDNTIWSTGANTYGQLGLGNTDTKYLFTNVSINNVKQIACGGSHTMILKNDGTLWAAGYNNYGQLGLGDTNNRSMFTQVPDITDVAQVACGDSHTFILKNDGTIWSTGRNSNGQLGLGTMDSSKTLFNKITTNADNIKQLFCGGNGSFILKNDGTAWSCGDNSSGQLGLGSTNASIYTFTKCTVTAEYNSNVTSIACGGTHTLIIKDNTVFACGDNSTGGLGTGDLKYRNSFVKSISMTETTAYISAGPMRSIVIDTDGNVYSCGDNSSGELGIGSSSSYQSTFTRCGSI